MKVSILTENRTSKRGFLAEHGLSVFIEYNGTRILFDTGQTDVYLRNAAKLGIDLRTTDLIVMSHGHYDHCGGYAFFPETDKHPTAYIRENAFDRKFIKDTGGYREICIPWDYESRKSSITLTGAKTRIRDDIYLLSDVPQTAAFEKLSDKLAVESGGKMITDPMSDEQLLVIDTAEGLVVFIGCAHPGIANCLNHVIAQFPDRKIRTVLAGMHLGSIDDVRFVKTVSFLKKLDIGLLIPLHCTGVMRECDMKRILEDECLLIGAGESFEI